MPVVKMMLPAKTEAEMAGESLVTRLRVAGFQGWFVGGAVRDRLLGREPHDIDIATDATPEQVETVFEGRARPLSARLGLVIVLWGGHELQVATFRAGADPAIQWKMDGQSSFGKTVEEDAAHRDFTINQIFYDPIAQVAVDRFGGQGDIIAKVIRATGNPRARMAEDWLRMIRAVRFALQLGFDIHPDTEAAIKAEAPSVPLLRGPRVFEELSKILTGPNPAFAVRLLDDLGLLRAIVPEVTACKGVEQPVKWHPEGDVWIHTTLALTSLPPNPDPRLAWAVLLHDIGKPPTAKVKPDGVNTFPGHSVKGAGMVEEVFIRLFAPLDFSDDVRRMVKHHMDFAMVKRMKKATIRRMTLRTTFSLEMELHRCDCTGRPELVREMEEMAGTLKALAEVPAPPPLVTGADVLALGVPTGPLIGKVLRIIRDLQFGERLSTREEALARLPGIVRGQQGMAASAT